MKAEVFKTICEHCVYSINYDDVIGSQLEVPYPNYIYKDCSS